MIKRRYKSSVYIRPTAREALDSRLQIGAGLSDVLCTVLERYEALCRQYRPEFTPDQWSFLQVALRGWKPDAGSSVEIIKDDLLLRLRREAAARTETSRAYDTINVVKGLTHARVVSLIDEVERYWITDNSKWGETARRHREEMK